ncbi:MAG: aminotransferase class I/II-fold pyridoxal phosphate-dependent enzyme [Haliscomenobacter sp.]|nr:aminotransferase class I/II-fold pyridoxal phosphate-dependent enzyme [Haliscomenobacter sp.]MCF8317639.1 aminotransferase class I/II-fold pyridoxal phosphate-dependent enzyme [Haliscomenobacter sp.]
MSEPIFSAATLCVQETVDPMDTSSHTLPIYATSSFVFDNLQQGIDIFSGAESGYLYGRFGNPTCDAVAEKLAALESYGLPENAHCVLVSSGMAAISAVLMALLKPGDKILTQADIYGGTTDFFNQILASYNIGFETADLNDVEQVENILSNDPSIRLIYLESPTNPILTCVDLEKLVSLAKKYNKLTVIDNTFCTPVVQQPLQWGIDYVVHSTTKYLNGHGNTISGCIIGKNAEVMQRVKQTVKLMGCSANPWDAWLVNNGLKTLALRMEKHSLNAMELAKFLSSHPSVKKVYYPGLSQHKTHSIASKQMQYFGGILSFELNGGIEVARKCIDKLKLATIAPTLGDVNTLIMHPYTMSHRNVPSAVREKYGISEGLIRVSVGIEAIGDLINDFRQSLAD